jgi:glycosyltransferase involved in cell wall biosynthesis
MKDLRQKLLTIVIPVYKVEKYIRQCMESVIVSPEWMDELEIIVVNDGTPDNSANIAREYAEKYPLTIKV